MLSRLPTDSVRLVTKKFGSINHIFRFSPSLLLKTYLLLTLILVSISDREKTSIHVLTLPLKSLAEGLHGVLKHAITTTRPRKEQDKDVYPDIQDGKRESEFWWRSESGRRGIERDRICWKGSGRCCFTIFPKELSILF